MSSLPNEKPQDEQQDQLLTAPTFAPPANGPRDGFSPPELHSPETAAAIPPLPPQDGHLGTAPFALETEAFPAPDPTLDSTLDPTLAQTEPSLAETPLFVASMLPEVQRPARIPHLGHLLLLLLILVFGVTAAIAAMAVAIHFHLYGVTSLQASTTEIHYQLGSEGLIYVFTLIGCLIVFPLIWHKGLFAGVQWNARTALRLSPWLVGTAFICFLLALLNTVVFPGPKNTPIEDVFREPGAAWLLFVFGVTFAPFFEEMFFRGFLLPSLATACDWIAEKFKHTSPRPVAENGHPTWSLTAMAIAAVLTSIPFAGMHAAQTGYSLGPFLLLVTVSLVLCTVRLWTRSLAASTLVHASYNFMLFASMLVASHGFRHMDKL
jgi:uncharacterized protein